MNIIKPQFCYDDFKKEFPINILIENYKEKVLTKTKFKLGLDCLSKLFFSFDSNYNDIKKMDSFLQYLAEGGFQVEEYARQHFPNGKLIDVPHRDFNNCSYYTRNFIEQNENITLFEAGFKHKNLFIRADIVVKKGNTLQLFEVKAKSYEGEDTIFGKGGQLKREWKPYFFDLAFQTYVVQLCFPEMKVESHFIFPDKNKKSSIDGLNQKYRFHPNMNGRKHVEVLDNSAKDWNDSLLTCLDQTDIIQSILNDEIPYDDELTFTPALNSMLPLLTQYVFPGAPLQQSKCKHCQYRKTEMTQNGNSGMAKCFAHHRNIAEAELYQPNLLDVWNLRNSNLFDQGHFLLSEIDPAEWPFEAGDNQFTPSQRQWAQITTCNTDQPIIQKEGLRSEMTTWKFPMHFIDFETTRSALPFFSTQHPYEQVAFQFSHHRLTEEGTLTHQNQFLIPDHSFPNFEFIRSLKESISQDDGTIFTYSHHENTVLNEIKDQLENSNEADRNELIAFIEAAQSRIVDLCKVVKLYYFHPFFGGSNSIKAVLPAILRCNDQLRDKYSQPIGAIPLTSLNFSEDHTWISANQINPYQSLPSIKEGGAAMAAYAQLMYTTSTEIYAQELRQGLLKYCELDTLAMVMLYEHLVKETE